jgi:hypothetical protein
MYSLLSALQPHSITAVALATKVLTAISDSVLVAGAKLYSATILTNPAYRHGTVLELM